MQETQCDHVSITAQKLKKKIDKNGAIWRIIFYQPRNQKFKG